MSGSVEAVAGATRLLAAVHGQVGACAPGSRSRPRRQGTSPRRCWRGAAGGCSSATAHRHLHLAQQPVAGAATSLDLPHSGQQHQELVPTDAADQGLRTPAARSRRPISSSSSSPAAWPIVVEGLEAVQVDEQQCAAVLLAPRHRGLVLEQLAKQRAVGQAGEMVVHGHLAELLVLGLQFLEQLLDARAHGVQVLAQLAQFIALAPTPAPAPIRARPACWPAASGGGSAAAGAATARPAAPSRRPPPAPRPATT
jgi:hypothetical protein